jgi:exonuclease III
MPLTLIETTNCLFINTNIAPPASVTVADLKLIQCTLFNAQSIVNKLPELHYLMYSCNFDIICITETWLKSEITDGLIDPQACFRVIRCDRSESRGGGVSILVSKKLHAVVIPVTNYFPSLEMLCVDIDDGDSRFRLFNLYRPPYYDCLSTVYMKQMALFSQIYKYCRAMLYRWRFKLPAY